jgi:phosphoribosyl-AMP cyclohydrolase
MDLDFSKLDGLIAAVVTDHISGRVLMVGFMNPEAWQRTIETGFVTFYSRSRNKLWMKGESSGHRLVVKEIRSDCDRDALVIAAEALGPGVCHEGYQSCFFRKWTGAGWADAEVRSYDPKAVYGN